MHFNLKLHSDKPDKMELAKVMSIIRRRWPLCWRTEIRPKVNGQYLTLKSWRRAWRILRDGDGWFYTDYDTNRYIRGDIELIMLETGYAKNMDKYEARFGRLIDKVLARRRSKHAIFPHAQRVFKTIHSAGNIFLRDKIFGDIPIFDGRRLSDLANSLEYALRVGCLCKVIKQLPMPIADEIIYYLE